MVCPGGRRRRQSAPNRLVTAPVTTHITLSGIVASGPTPRYPGMEMLRMRVSQSARYSLATAVLLVAGLTACSKDQGPSEFNPAGVSADLTTAQGAFSSPVTASFEATGAEIAATLGAAGPVVISPKMA